jgi:hypothetical protein
LLTSEAQRQGERLEQIAKQYSVRSGSNPNC